MAKRLEAIQNRRAASSGGQAFDIDALVAAPVAKLILVETERHVEALAAYPRW
jgi:hypothetical protein